MKVYHLSYPVQLNNLEPSCVAIGNFDGVHKGHQRVIQEAIRVARQNHLASGVMTFHPHPKEVLGVIRESEYLTPLPDKLALFEGIGVDLALVVQFTLPFSQLSPEQFIQQFIVNLNIKHVVTGFDFCFGQKGRGNVDTLAKWSGERGDFTYHRVAQISLGEEKISSSRVRSLLSQGDVSGVCQLLGRPYRIKGKVVEGEQRGRTIGFPTANLSLLQPYALPRQGVYAVYVHHQGRLFPGVINIGTKPTFHQTEKMVTLEVHLLDFNGNLYGETLSVDFIRFLRQERAFASVKELCHQIEQDVHLAKKIL